MKPIFLRDAEAEAWKPGEVVLWREISKQPPDGHIFTGYVLDTTGNRRMISMVAWHCVGMTCQQGFYVRPPFHPGDNLAVKETWRLIKVNANIDSACFIDIQYRLGYGVSGYSKNWREQYQKLITNITWSELSVIGYRYSKWYSPATMPSRAVRHFATVRAVDAVERDGKWFWKITLEATR